MSDRRRRSFGIRKTRPEFRPGRGTQGIRNGHGDRRFPLTGTGSFGRTHQGRGIRFFERGPHRRRRGRKPGFLRSYDGFRIFHPLAFKRTVLPSTKRHRPRNRFFKRPLRLRTDFPFKRNGILRIGIRSGNGRIGSALRGGRLRMTLSRNGRSKCRVERRVAIGERNMAPLANPGTMHVRLRIGIFLGRKRVPRGLRNSGLDLALVSRIRPRFDRRPSPFADRFPHGNLGLRNRSGQRNAHGRFRRILR